MKKQLLIVGNAPLPERRGAEIDAADRVMRFNESAQDASHVGTKTDILLLATSSKAMGCWLRRPDFLSSPIVRNTPEILCAIHPAIIRKYHPQPNLLSRLKGRRADWTPEVIEAFGQIGKTVTILPVQDYQSACDALSLPEAERHRVFPSTGFLGIWWALRRFPPEEWQIRICGFQWQGWKRHAWDAEKAWIGQRLEEGRLAPLA